MKTENKVARTIPQDLIIEILMRLPVKTLLKLKAVCKNWCKLINSANFIRMHHNRPIVNHRLLFSKYGDDVGMFYFHSIDESFNELPISYFQLPPNLGFRHVHVIGSYKGIVCFKSESEIYLCNPATREIKQLPPSSDTRRGKRYKPCFGFDSSDIYNFKVVRLYYCIDGNEKVGFRGEVYTLSSNAWRQLDWRGGKNIVPNRIDDRLNKFYRNFCHWNINIVRRNSLGSGHEPSILRFDMHTESFSTIGFPKDYISKHFGIIVVFKGYLAVCDYLNFRSRNVEQIIEIWIMKEYGVEDSWTKLCTSVPTLRLFPFSFSLYDASDDDDEKPILWNHQTGTHDYHTCRWPYTSSIVIYRETLVSLK